MVPIQYSIGIELLELCHSTFLSYDFNKECHLGAIATI